MILPPSIAKVVSRLMLYAFLFYPRLLQGSLFNHVQLKNKHLLYLSAFFLKVCNKSSTMDHRDGWRHGKWTLVQLHSLEI